MFRFLLCLLAVVFLPVLTVAQTNAGPTPVNLSSPFHTIYTHLQNLQEENFYPEVAASAFNGQPGVPNTEQAQDLAIQLKQILDGEGIYIVEEDLPTNPNYVDSANENKPRYVLSKQLPEVYLVKTNGQWKYSAQTVKIIPALHRKVYPYGTDRLLNLLPALGNTKFLGLYVWQYLSLIIILSICGIFYAAFTYLLRRILTRLLLRKGYKELARKLILPIARPLSLFFVALLLLVLIRVVQLPIYTFQYITLVIRALLPLFITIVFYRLVDVLGIYLTRLAAKTDSSMDDQLVPLVIKALRPIVVIVGGIFIIESLNVNVTPLIAGISIGGLALALAAQDTLKNFFGSVMIFLDRPFQIGQWITAGSLDGTVEEVGFRSTRIRTFRNSLLSVPNGKLADMAIDNHGMREYRRFYTNIALQYDTPVTHLEQFVQGLRKIVLEHPETRKDYFEIHMNDMAASSLNVMFYIFFAVPTWSDELRCRHEVILAIIKLAQKLGVQFAFPTQTLHMETFPEKAPLSAQYPDTEATLKEKVAAFKAFEQDPSTQ